MTGAVLRRFCRLMAGASVLALALSACDQAPSGAAGSASGPSPAASSRAAGDDGDGQIIDHFTPQNVAATFDQLGLPYAIETDPRGYPMIVVDPRPFPVQQFNVLFFGCDKVDASCEDLTLWAWYDMNQRVSEKDIFAWNNPFKERRWSTAYLDEDNSPSLVLNINATGGIGARALQILVNTYLEDVFAFHDSLTASRTASNDSYDRGDSVGMSETRSSALVDSDVLKMTDLIKDYGGAGFAHTKQIDKKF